MGGVNNAIVHPALPSDEQLIVDMISALPNQIYSGDLHKIPTRTDTRSIKSAEPE
jgi:hypothetical protein